MYEYIIGTLKEVNPTFIIIESNEIGYFINISLNTYSEIQDKKEEKLKILLHQIVKEDSNAFFGFYSSSERQIFRLLITVSGVGSNTARMMLSSFNPLQIKEAIVNQEVNELTKIKGIGTKSAQRLIVELKDKLSKIKSSDDKLFSEELGELHDIKQEASNALENLGFNKKRIEKVIEKLLNKNKNNSLESLIKEALKIL